MGVDLGGADILVSQQLLDSADVIPRLQLMGGKRVAQRVDGKSAERPLFQGFNKTSQYVGGYGLHITVFLHCNSLFIIVSMCSLIKA